ncbi:MAG: hypothetical protein UY53_C0001G0074 [Parcubacteria group bacterium GW2011_GWA2_50_10]|nr:MAG: hypothetical protein UY53_C0001G0074 [Parcubacteria group bacterium GW2011_GWA2_50_10]
MNTGEETALIWRVNNRDNPYLFRDTLLKLLKSEKLLSEKLVVGQNQHVPLAFVLV